MTAEDAGSLAIQPHATGFWFSLRRSGRHMSRSMMLPELRPTFSSRQKSEKHLYELYGLDPSLALFRLLRRFAAEAPDALPLLTLT